MTLELLILITIYGTGVLSSFIYCRYLAIVDTKKGIKMEGEDYIIAIIIILFSWIGFLYALFVIENNKY